jgi:ABC-2 type transport system ATP-binding protein
MDKEWSMTEPSVIKAERLEKRFGRTLALNEFAIDVKPGEIHGFLGPNGGKSTTIRIILGLLKRSGGTIEVFGEDPWLNATQLPEKFAYVPGDVNFWPNLTGGEIIDILCELRGGIDESRRTRLIKEFQLDVQKKFRTYSKGNRQKVALIAALASDVPLYILDEPTSGLDPLMEQVFQDEIRRLKKQKKTVLLSSHILSEVEALCDRVTIIREGANAGVYTLKELKAEHENLEKLFLSKYESEA